MKRSKQITRVILLGVGLTAIFQNCAPSAFISTQSAYPLPFSSQKVQLSDRLFKAAKNDPQGPRLARTGTELSVFVNNECAAQMCATAGSETSVACWLWGHDRNPSLAKSYQFYHTSTPSEMTSDEIVAWTDTSPIDKTCLLGVSDFHRYKHHAFNDSLVSNQKAANDLVRLEAGATKISDADLTRVKVAVIDTGVEDHADLPTIASRDDMRESVSKADPQCPATAYQDYYGHGTAVASVIAAVRNNGKGIVGYSTNADIYALMIGRCSDSQSSTTEIGNAVLRAIDYGVDVINISYGGNSGDDIGLRQAFLTALGKNIVIVVAAGNNGQDFVAGSGKETYPAAYANAYRGVIAVAASDPTGKLAAFSNFNVNAAKIIAPGQDLTLAASLGSRLSGIFLVDNGSRYTIASGTSFSAPMVTAAVAETIGYLKSKKIPYDASYVESLVTEVGMRKSYDVISQVRNGAFLDFSNLGDTLVGLTNTSPSTSGISTSFNLSSNASGPTATVTVYWNLTSVHQGARLGIYDGTCPGTAVTCLIQDVPLSGPSGFYTFTLTRNDLVPMLPDGTEATFALPLRVSIHYPIPAGFDANGKPTGYKSNHGEDATRLIDVRSFDNSKATSQLIGRVTNIRTDMQNLYVQGWSCYQGDNEAVMIGLRDLSGANLPTRFIYSYPYMIPHGSPIDSSGLFGSYNGLDGTEILNPFLAQGIKTNFMNLVATHPAGYETDPSNVSLCGNYTSAHGFEMVLPFWKIRQDGLVGRQYRVVAQAKSKEVSLIDGQGVGTFEIPEVNYQTSVASSLSVSRTNDFVLSGSICSNSPSPVEVEVSADLAQYFKAFYDKGIPKSDPGGYKPMVFGSGSYFYHDPKDLKPGTIERIQIVFKDPTVKQIYSDLPSYVANLKNAEVDVKITPDYMIFDGSQGSDPDTQSRDLFYPVAIKKSLPFPANAQLDELYVALYTGAPLTDAEQALVDDAESVFSKRVAARVDALGLKQIFTGQPLQDFSYMPYHLPRILSPLGSMVQASRDRTATDRANLSIALTDTTYWDYFDVGDDFSPMLVGYKFDETKPYGTYLKATYGVTQTLREKKKFETPNANRQVILGHFNLAASGAGACGSGTEHRLSGTITGVVDYAAILNYSVAGLWVQGRSPAGFVPPDAVPDVMRRLPFSLRFFQDGKLLLHTESLKDGSFRNVDYPFMKDGY